jgi:hypothetical protein
VISERKTLLIFFSGSSYYFLVKIIILYFLWCERFSHLKFHFIIFLCMTWALNGKIVLFIAFPFPSSNLECSLCQMPVFYLYSVSLAFTLFQCHSILISMALKHILMNRQSDAISFYNFFSRIILTNHGWLSIQMNFIGST